MKSLNYFHCIGFIFILLCANQSYSINLQSKKNQPTKRPTCLTTIRVPIMKSGIVAEKVNDKWVGLGPALIEDLFKDTNCKYQFIEMPLARAWLSLQNGEVDLLPVSPDSPEREKFAFVFTLFNSQYGFGYLKPWTADNLNKAISEGKANIGIIRSNLPVTKMDPVLKNYPSSKLMTINEIPTLLLLLKEGRIDTIYSHPYLFLNAIIDMKLQNEWSVLVRPNSPAMKLCSFLSKQMNANDASIVRALLEDYIAKGKHWKILEQSIGPSMTRKMQRDQKLLNSK